MDKAAETNRERQENELEVLQSIFAEDLQDVRIPAKKWKPLNLKIQLRPQKGSSGDIGEHVSVILQITCSSKYPKQAPKIQLERPKGLSDVLCNELLALLDKEAKMLEGEVMIFELCQIGSTFLHRHNRPPRGSFYDQMKEDHQKRENVKVVEEEQKRQKIQEEVTKRKQQLKIDAKIRRSLSESSPTHHRTPTNSETSEFSPAFHNAACEEHQRTETLTFGGGRKIIRGSCLGHSQQGCIAYSAIDLDSGQLLYLTEWQFRHAQLEARNLTPDRFIETLERQMATLITLRHKNLVTYEDLLCQRRKDAVIVHVVQGFILGTSVSCLSTCFCAEGGSFVAKGILEALIYLHNNGVTHNYLFETTVFIDKASTIRVSDFALIPYLQELMTGQKQQMRDLPALGALIEALLPTSYSEMRDFVEKCRSDRTLSASDLLDHAFLLPTQEVPKTEIVAREASGRPHSQQIVPFNAPLVPKEKSRIQNEFEFLAYLGKGAYGDVLKVRNILDNRQYAIKRIPLPLRSKQIYRKMTREVELLSRLNHENVVRYYNSWIEIGTESDDAPTPLSATNEWSISQGKATPARVIQAESSDSESSDWINFMPANVESSSEDDGIEFANSNGQVVKWSDEESEKSLKESQHRGRGPEIQFMYIQMEFCEKSTLRTAIDAGLYADTERKWRLFREICEGLLHIHQQGMIHRDLKPVNVFLDSRDQVKIGDFGLATTSILALQDHPVMASQSASIASGTGKVGTTLYVAPELSGMASRSTYNQKVDLYSLGVILFEMCSPPFNTAMDRIKTILALRTSAIVLPESMTRDPKNDAEMKVIRWLLNHDPRKRPTVEELLASEHIPPAKLEAGELQEALRHVMSNPQSRIYKHLIARCMAQESDLVCQLTFHLGMVPIQSIFELVKNRVSSLFCRHGGIEIITPLLTPYSRNNQLNNAVKLMTHSGAVVFLPYDLRQPFIRHVATNGITAIRRYSLGRVYREKKVFNFHPKQIHEAAFDVISPSAGSLLVDAELIFMAFEISVELPVLKKNNIRFRLNHTSLLRSIMLHCNVPTEKQADVIAFTADFIEGKISKFQLTSSINSALQTLKTNSLLIELLSTDVTIRDISGSSLRALIRGRGEAAQLAKGAIRELESVINLAQGFGVTCPINITVGATCGNYFRSKTGSILWQMLCDVTVGRHNKTITLAAGGRYDSYIADYQKVAQNAGIAIPNREISGAGFSFALDKLVYAINESKDELEWHTIDVVVCVSGSRPPLKDVTQILRSLWAAGIKSGVAEALHPEEAQDIAKDLGAQHIILLGEGGVLIVRSWRENNFHERFVPRSELIEYVKRMLATPESPPIEHSMAQATFPSITPKSLDGGGAGCKLNFVFVVNEKLTANKRRRYEGQIEQNVSGALAKFVKKETITFVVVELSTSVLKALVALVDPIVDPHSSQNNELKVVIERFPKQKRYISEIYDEISDILSDVKNPSIVGIYSLSDSYFRLIL